LISNNKKIQPLRKIQVSAQPVRILEMSTVHREGRAHTSTHTYTLSLTHALTHTYTRTSTHSLAHTRPFFHMSTHTHTHTHSLTHSLSLSLSHTHTHTLSRTNSPTPTHIFTVLHAHTHSLSYTHTPMHTHTHHRLTLAATKKHKNIEIYCLPWHNSRQWAKASSFLRLHNHTQTHHTR